MLIPIGDENPCARRPYATWGLMALLGLIGFVLAAQSGHVLWRPAPGSVFWVPGPFVTQGLADLVLSLLFLWIFADNVEDQFGPAGVLAGFLLAGWAGQGAHALAAEAAEAWHGPVYGTTGIVAAYVTLFPRHEIALLNLLPLLFSNRTAGFPGLGDRPEVSTIHVQAWWMTLLWPAFVLACDGLNGIGVSLAGLVAAGAFGTGAARLGVRWLGIRLAEPPTGEAVHLYRSAEPETPPDEAESSTRKGPAPLAVPTPAVRRDSRPTAAFLELESEPEEVVDGVPDAAAGTGGFAVIRVTEDLADVSELGRIVSERTGEVFGDVTRRIRATRGLLVREATREVAQAVLDDLRRTGVEAALVDLAVTPYFPEPRLIGGAGCSADGCEFEIRDGERVTIPWRRISLIAAGQVEKRRRVLANSAGSSGSGSPLPLETVEKVCIDSLIDFIVTAPRLRLRLYRQDTNFRLMTEAGGAGGELGFKRFVKALLEHRAGTPVNTGLKVLDGGGRWGYLRFRSERDFDDYCWWLDRLLSWRAARHNTASFLE